MDKIERIKELTDILNECRDMYYNYSESLVPDIVYDARYDELQMLELETGVIMSNSPTQTVGYEVKSKLEKVRHSHPMLSLGKTKSVDDLVRFAGNKECILSLKLDGLTVLLTYENGELIKAETRGDGEYGEDITHVARVFDNIPLKIAYKGCLEVEGEAIITYDKFDYINKMLPDNEKYKNPRNLASGSVRQLDSGVAAQRHLSFICWKVPYIGSGFRYGNKMSSKLEYVKKLGFEVVRYCVLNNDAEHPVYDDVVNVAMEILKGFAKTAMLPIDGLVMSYDDITYGESLGMTGHHPRHSIAYKFYDEEVETTIRDVEFSMGKTGILTPVAIFDTVEIDGTDVSRASLHNISILEDLEIGIEDIVTVYKANQIIPQVKENVTRSGKFCVPNTCPVCGGKTEIVKDNDTKVLVCTNNNCKGKLLGKLTHAVSKNALNIDGLSESTLEKFIELGWVSSIKDMYHLDDHSHELLTMEGFGGRSVEKLIKSVEDSRKTTLSRFLYALSIPLIGKTASKDISKECGGDIEVFKRKINSHDKNVFINIDGFGSEMSKSLMSWWEENKSVFTELESEFTFDTPTNTTSNSLNDKTFVITGSLTHYQNRDELVAEIESLGGKVASSVSAKTDYLINNDTESQSSKNKKAKQLNIPIISEEDFLLLVNQ